MRAFQVELHAAVAVLPVDQHPPHGAWHHADIHFRHSNTLISASSHSSC
jgi:hypothetical protein